MPSRLHIRRGVLVLIVACVCALAVEWVVLTTFVFPVPRPLEGWSPYAKEYYEFAGAWVGSAVDEYTRTRAGELAEQTDGVVNVADYREAICQVWVETHIRRMPSDMMIDHAYANGFVSNVTIAPNSTIDTMEEAYLALEIWEYAGEGHERIIELRALDNQ